MVSPRANVVSLAMDQSGPGTQPGAHPSERSARAERQPRRSLPLTRRYEVAYLSPFGHVEDAVRVAPATPVFEDAFAALGRGALISTTGGPVAVEDLVPGTLLETVHNGPQQLLWVGSMTVFPESSEIKGGETARLTRVATDAFGLGRPMPDLVLGPRARVLYRNSRCREFLGTNHAFAPARAFVDGMNVIEVAPVSAVRVYHLALQGQQTLIANGMEVESYHPGPQIESMLERSVQDLFLGLFPHIQHLHDFGPMSIPRLTAFELENLRG